MSHVLWSVRCHQFWGLFDVRVGFWKVGLDSALLSWPSPLGIDLPGFWEPQGPKITTRNWVYSGDQSGNFHLQKPFDWVVIYWAKAERPGRLSELLLEA